MNRKVMWNPHSTLRITGKLGYEGISLPDLDLKFTTAAAVRGLQIQQITTQEALTKMGLLASDNI